MNIISYFACFTRRRNINKPSEVSSHTSCNIEIRNDDKPYCDIEKWGSSNPFIPPLSEGHVIKVYDGDTITVLSELFVCEKKDINSATPIAEPYRFNIRLSGIDCPEMKSKKSSEKECAIIARNEVARLIMNKKVYLKNIMHEKYGRILAEVWIGDICINKRLIDMGLAVEYKGDTKKSPENWMTYYNSHRIISPTQ